MRVVNTKTAIFRFREGMEVLLASKVNLDVNQLLLETARTLDEASDAERRNALLEDLNSWQRELTTEMAAEDEPRPSGRGSSKLGESREAGQRSPSAAVAGLLESFSVSSWTWIAISRSLSPCSRAWCAQNRSSPPPASSTRR